MRESDRTRVAYITTHLDDIEAIKQLLRMAEELHTRSELEAINEVIDEEREKAAKAQAVLTAERDEALKQVQELKFDLLTAQAGRDLNADACKLKKELAPPVEGWIPNVGEYPSIQAPLWVRFESGEVRKLAYAGQVSWCLTADGCNVTHYRTTPPPDETTKENDNGND